jgi:hypothetical protein
MTSRIGTTLGALLLGGFCAAAWVPVLAMLIHDQPCSNYSLSGVVVVQTFLYIKLFPRDSTRVKAMVSYPLMVPTRALPATSHHD